MAFGMRYLHPWRWSLIVSVIPFARLLPIPFSALPDAIGLLKLLIRFQYEDMEDMIPEYDTQSDEIVFAPDDLDEVDPFEELPF